MKAQPMGRAFKVTLFVGERTGSVDSQIAFLDRKLRSLKSEIGLDGDPEETSRRALIYQE